ncbi:MAG: amidohydrolase family protein [Leptolyngbyaceae cyanobacterium SM2_3_12]|nr:amidohydrolase family protein [Leptolyngbyaceae cyanobacterium SM2_3_12]
MKGNNLPKLIALGMNLHQALAAVTCNPAQGLQAEAEIGILKVGTRADITVLDWLNQPWTLPRCPG